MLTKDQANTMSDALLAPKREQLVESRNRRVRRVAWLYQVHGLRALQPDEQAQLFSAAEKAVASSVAFWMALASFWLAVAAVWYWGTPATPTYTLAAGLAALFGASLVRLPFLRTKLRKLIDTLHTAIQRE